MAMTKRTFMPGVAALLVFDQGLSPIGQRWCINGIAKEFILA